MGGGDAGKAGTAVNRNRDSDSGGYGGWAKGDGADVTVQFSDFTYTMHGTQDDSPGQVRVLFLPTLNDAITAALINPSGHFTTERYLRSLVDGNFYVAAGMEIQPAVDAAGNR